MMDSTNLRMAKQINQIADLSRNPQSATPSTYIGRLDAVSTLDFISTLPYKLATYLIGSMNVYAIVQMGQTSTHWKNISGDHDLWKLLFTNNLWKYDQQAIDNYLVHGELPNRPLCEQRGLDKEDGDIQTYHYQAQYDRRLINWKRLYRNRMLIERRWRDGDYRVSVFSTTNSNIIDDWNYCIQFDDNILISGSKDCKLKIWSMDTATHQYTLSGHSGSVLCLQFDGDRLISGSSDTTMIVWDLATRSKLWTLEGHSEAVLALQFSGQRLVSGSKDRTIRVWDLETGLTTLVLTGHGAAINAMRLKDDRIVSASGDRTLRLWNASSGDLIRTFASHHRGVACVDFDNNYIISGSSDNTIKVFDSTTGDCLRTISGHTDLVRTLQWDPLSDRIISGSYDGSLRIWNLENGTLLQTLDDNFRKRILNIKADYSKIVCAGSIHGIFVYDFAYALDTLFLA